MDDLTGGVNTEVKNPIPIIRKVRKMGLIDLVVPAEKGIKMTACRRSAFNHGCDDSFKAVLFYVPKHIE